MAVIERDYNLIISIDPGFSSTKISVNGILLDSVPGSVVDITGMEDSFLTDKKENFILSKFIEDKSVLVGAYARQYLSEDSIASTQDVKQSMLTSMNKFSTDDSRINIMTCIGLALIKWEEYTKEKKLMPEFSLAELEKPSSNWRVFVGITLPIEAVKGEWAYIKQYIVGHHRFDIEVGQQTYTVDFSIGEKRCAVLGQAQAALMGLLIDDNGEAIDDPEVLVNKPILVIDGGYRTVGIFKLNEVNSIMQAESNTDFAMYNVNSAVAHKLVEDYGRNNIREYNIDNIISNGGSIKYKDKESGMAKTLDVEALRREEISLTSKKLFNYINEKFNDLLDIRQIVVAGGTGAAYFDNLKEYIMTTDPDLADKTKLLDYEFNGEKLDPVNAVVAGMYKVMKKLVNDATKASKEAK